MRYEIFTVRRTSRFTVYGIYDNEACTALFDRTSRDRSEIVKEVRVLNAAVEANPINQRAEAPGRLRPVHHHPQSAKLVATN